MSVSASVGELRRLNSPTLVVARRTSSSPLALEAALLEGGS